MEKNRYGKEYTYPVVVAVAETLSPTWDPAGAATPNFQPGQEGVAWASAAVIDVDAAGVGAAAAWRDPAAAA